MRLGWSKKGNSVSYYVHKTIRVDGKNKSKVIKRFGSEKYICETYGVTDAKAWCQEQVELLRQQEDDDNGMVTLGLYPSKALVENQRRCFNGGYLFLQDIYYELGLDKICKAIAKKHAFDFNLNSILSRLVYSRILYPGSKRSTFEDSHKYIEQPDFDIHQIYRALSVLAEESDYIQKRLFKNSLAIHERKTGVIYYDCTNFYFEIEQAEDEKQYGLSKDNKPLPIIQMGLFMDAEGIPLAFNMYPGNQNEQLSLIPLEQKLLENFDMSKFVVCTDAGLSSNDNRRFNDYDEEDGLRAYITTQSIKKLKKYQKDWALEPTGWRLAGDKTKTTYDITELDEEKDFDKLFYKSRWINEDGIEQQLMITYSLKYKQYHETIRQRQIERALKAVSKGKSGIEHKRPNDPLRFIKADHATKDGEKADKTCYYVDQSLINDEAKYDGFYGVCTNLEDDVESIIKINRRRWEIEECFRIMKSEFEARPVYLQREERIRAHFMTCFIALIIYRYLEKKTGDKYTCSELISTLQEMEFLKYEGQGYVPTYIKTEITNTLHDAFGFDTSSEIVTIKKMKKILSQTKK